MKLDQINQLTDSGFIELLGGIYEHSPWVAESVAGQRPFASFAELASAMKESVEMAEKSTRVQLLKAHPEFAGKAAIQGELTEASTREQGSLSLNNLPSEQHKKMLQFNRSFMNKFGFPGIVAVRMQSSVDGIFSLFEQRLENTLEQEISAAIEQVHLIAKCRLQDLVDE